MASKLYLTVDSSGIDEIPINLTIPLENYIWENYTRISLRHIYLQQETDVRLLFQFKAKTKPIYVRCNLLNKNDNLVNGEKSDVLAVIYPASARHRNFLNHKPANNFLKLIKPDTKITLSLTGPDGTPVDSRSQFEVVYELEFSWV